MSCHVEEIEFGGVKSNLFICSAEPDREPQPCAFCGAAAADLLCDWPVPDKRVEVSVREAKAGDTWITQRARKRARIAAIEELDINGRLTEKESLSRRIWVAIPGHPDPYPYRRYNDGDTFMTERPGTCDAPICELHAREVGEDLHYCQNHWRAWEDAA